MKTINFYLLNTYSSQSTARRLLIASSESGSEQMQNNEWGESGGAEYALQIHKKCTNLGTEREFFFRAPQIYEGVRMAKTF